MGRNCAEALNYANISEKEAYQNSIFCDCRSSDGRINFEDIQSKFGDWSDFKFKNGEQVGFKNKRTLSDDQYQNPFSYNPHLNESSINNFFEKNYLIDNKALQSLFLNHSDALKAMNDSLKFEHKRLKKRLAIVEAENKKFKLKFEQQSKEIEFLKSKNSELQDDKDNQKQRKKRKILIQEEKKQNEEDENVISPNENNPSSNKRQRTELMNFESESMNCTSNIDNLQVENHDEIDIDSIIKMFPIKHEDQHLEVSKEIQNLNEEKLIEIVRRYLFFFFHYFNYVCFLLFLD